MLSPFEKSLLAGVQRRQGSAGGLFLFIKNNHNVLTVNCPESNSIRRGGYYRFWDSEFTFFSEKAAEQIAEFIRSVGVNPMGGAFNGFDGGVGEIFQDQLFIFFFYVIRF
jgi:hypothetical protein